jgi:branched-chain amino acid transport system ATP-binding protein
MATATTEVPAGGGKPGVIERMMSSLRTGLEGQSAYPMAILTLVFAVETFDNAAFGLLTPEIAADLRTDASTIGLLFVPQLLLGMFLPIVFGYLGDHFNRIRLIVVALTAWTLATFLTATVTAIAVLLAFRLLAAASKGANGINGSLLADYYATGVRGVAYGMYSSAGLWGTALASVLAGFVAEHWGWRVAFVVLAIPGLLLIVATLRLRDPARGLREAQEAGGSEAPPLRQLGPIRTARQLLRIRSFKWLCAGASAGFGAVAMAGPALAFYFSAVFNVQPFIRGVIAGASLPLTIAALFIGGVIGQRMLKAGRSDIVVTFTAAIYVVAAACYFVMAIAPNLAVAVVALFAAETFTSLAGVPLFLLIASLVPANVRTQGFGVLAFALLALSPITVPVGLAIGDDHGFRFALAAAAPLFLAGALFIWISSRYSRQDVTRAIKATLAEVEARERRASGEAIGVLDVRGLDASYGSVQVLFDVDFHVGHNETVALLGTNGAGKSTLLRAINGLVTPTNGMVLLEGEDMSNSDAETMASRGVVTVPGGSGIFPKLSVERNLMLGGYVHWRDDEHLRQARADVLELFPVLADRLNQPAGTLSGGEQQMLTLAQGLMAQPKVLMIDELSLGLAPAIVQDLLLVVAEIQARGIPMIIVEQSVNIALSLASRAYFMEKGEIRFEGPAQELLGRTDLLRSIFLEGATRSEGRD